MQTAGARRLTGEQMNAESSLEIGIYVYAVVRAGGEPAAGILPVSGVFPGAEVYTVARENTLAVVSPIPLLEFRSKILEADGPRSDWICSAVLGHQNVLAWLMTYYTVVPFRFCSVYPDEEKVRLMLERNRSGLEEAIMRLQGAAEWGVKLFYDWPSLQNWVRDHSKALARQQAAIDSATRGTAFFLRKKWEQSVKEETERAACTCARAIHVGLSQWSRQAIANTLQTGAPGRETNMALNGAYLVDNSCLPDFQAELASLQLRYAAQRFLFELTGPWAPYNFAAVDLVA